MTLKEFKFVRSEIESLIRVANLSAMSGREDISKDCMDEVNFLRKAFDELPKVFVSFWIKTNLYREVYKLGSKYIDINTLEIMTKENGFRNIEEIPEITKEMKDEMNHDRIYGS